MGNPIPLESGRFYHIFNRGNDRGNIFLEERNYAFFLKLWARYASPVADTYADCLLRNHFHAAIRIKDELRSPRYASQHLSNLFNAYARAVNLATGRSGALFERRFHRIEVSSENYLAQLVVYIHQNAQKHGFAENFADWPHSSFHELAAETGWALANRQLVFELFGGRDQFLQIHAEIQPRIELEDEI